MSVYIKGDKISKVYFGGDNIVKIYKGRDLVFGGDGGGDDGYWFKATTTKDLSTYNVICNSIYSNNAFIGTVYPTSALTQGTYKFNEDNIKNGSGSFDNYIGISLSDGATTPTYAPISYIKFLPSYTEKFNTIGTFKKIQTLPQLICQI